ncbi:hypothetical protein L195_g029860, partial [Trifolium pratense]
MEMVMVVMNGGEDSGFEMVISEGMKVEDSGVDLVLCFCFVWFCV